MWWSSFIGQWSVVQSVQFYLIIHNISNWMVGNGQVFYGWWIMVDYTKNIHTFTIYNLNSCAVSSVAYIILCLCIAFCILCRLWTIYNMQFSKWYDGLRWVTEEEKQKKLDWELRRLMFNVQWWCLLSTQVFCLLPRVKKSK